MIRLLTHIIIACAALFGAPRILADSAETILAQTAGRLQSAKSLTVNAIITAQGATSHASIISESKAFVVQTPGIEIWFDGTTQWTLNKSANETSVTTPTSQEIAQINPLAIIASLSKDFTPTLMSPAAPTEKRLMLTPRRSHPFITSAIVEINSSTLMPTQITVNDTSGQTTTLKITSIKTGQRLPRSTFVYNAAAHPGVEIVDLR